MKEIEQRLAAFKADEANRMKDKCSSMGDILAYLLVSSRFKLPDLVGEYMDESLDRQGLWMLRDVPELADVSDNPEETKDAFIDEKRDEVAFKTNIVSNRVLLFSQHFAAQLRDRTAMFNAMDAHFGQLPDTREHALQMACEDIR